MAFCALPVSVSTVWSALHVAELVHCHCFFVVLCMNTLQAVHGPIDKHFWFSRLETMLL